VKLYLLSCFLYFIVIILGQYIVQGLCKDHTVSQYPF